MSAFDSQSFASLAFDALAIGTNLQYKYINQTRFPAKRPIDEIIFTVDFTSVLSTADGEEILSVEWYVVDKKTGTVKSDMVKGYPRLDGNVAHQIIAGGTNKNIYTAYCAATTTMGQVITLPPVGKGYFSVSTL